MTELQLLHFVVRRMTTELTANGVLVTCYTNNACHLWLRWTNIEPQKHIIPREQRGGLVNTYIDQCFVAFHDVEQTEANDTWTHTFLVEPWPSCETRWFYFWATIGGQPSPSASCIFTYHRPFIATFKPAKLSGNITCDAHIQRWSVSEFWPVIITAPGNYASTWSPNMSAACMASPIDGKWQQNSRALMTFDLRTIDAAAKITYAVLEIWAQAKSNTLGSLPAVGVYLLNPDNPAILAAQDYAHTGNVLLTNAINYADYHVDAWNKFTFTDQGRGMIPKARVIGLAIKEVNYDAAATPPPWSAGAYHSFYMWCADYPWADAAPRLTIGWTI